MQDWIDLVMSMWRGVVVSLGGDVSGTFLIPQRIPASSADNSPDGPGGHDSHDSKAECDQQGSFCTCSLAFNEVRGDRPERSNRQRCSSTPETFSDRFLLLD